MKSKSKSKKSRASLPAKRVVQKVDATVYYGENNVTSLQVTKSWGFQRQVDYIWEKFPSVTRAEIAGEFYTFGVERSSSLRGGKLIRHAKRRVTLVPTVSTEAA